MHPEGSIASSSFGHIVNKTHFDRIVELLGRTKGKVEVGGKSDVDSLKVDLTVVSNVDGDDPLMQEYTLIILFLNGSIANNSIERFLGHSFQSSPLSTLTKLWNT